MAPRKRPHPYRKLTLPKDAPFELRPAPGKGWGAFATREIHDGEEILDELPLLWTDNCLEHLTEDMVQKAIAGNLDDDQLSQVALLRVDSDRTKPFDTFLEAFKAHDFMMDDKTMADGGHIHSFQIIASRFNHSCVPNMVNPQLINPNFRAKDGVTFVATKDIPKDTELTFSYGAYFECLTRAERHLDLRLSRCVCDLCTASPQEQYLSNLRRRLIRGLHYLVFGFDLAELGTKHPNQLKHLSEQDVVVDIRDCIHSSELRKEAEEYRIPITSRLAYCLLVLALLEAEGILNAVMLDRFGILVQMIYKSLVDEDNVRICRDAMTMPNKVGWRGRFVAVMELFGRADAGDKVGSTELTTWLKKIRGEAGV